VVAGNGVKGIAADHEIRLRKGVEEGRIKRERRERSSFF